MRDLPYPLHRAVKLGLMFLSFEDLMQEDRPPRHIWLDNAALKEHFDGVSRRQKDSTSGREIEDPVQNAAVDLLIVGDG